MNPLLLSISLRRRKGITPRETTVKATKVPILTRLANWSKETNPLVKAITTVTAYRATLGVCVFSSNLLKEAGSRPSRPI